MEKQSQPCFRFGPIRSKSFRSVLCTIGNLVKCRYHSVIYRNSDNRYIVNYNAGRRYYRCLFLLKWQVLRLYVCKQMKYGMMHHFYKILTYLKTGSLRNCGDKAYNEIDILFHSFEMEMLNYYL